MNKKPFYKKGWFLVLMSVIGFYILGVIVLIMDGDSIKEKNKEIKGDVLYIYRNEAYDKRLWYQHKSASEFEKVIVPEGVNTVCVWYKTDFTDTYGNVKEDTAYRISLSVEAIRSIDWSNFIPKNIESLPSAEVYAWSGLK